MSFLFLQTASLIDDELELIAPEVRWIDALLASCAHPLSVNDPAARATTRTRVMDFLRTAPSGRQQADPLANRVPCYHFWMRLHPTAQGAPPVQIGGGIALRIGDTEDLRMYVGHIGYNVYPPARGHHYAERSSRLLLGIARAHGIRQLWITCNPDNWASRRTCERLGGQLAEIVAVPTGHPLHHRGDREKCRYWIDL